MLCNNIVLVHVFVAKNEEVACEDAIMLALEYFGSPANLDTLVSEDLVFLCSCYSWRTLSKEPKKWHV